MEHQFPPPTTDVDFERFCCDFLRAYWPKSNPQRWGRSGQKQHGVDIIDMNAHEPLRGAQVKFRKIGAILSAAEVEAEVREAESFNLNELRLGHYTILTTSESDTVLQGKVIQLNREHGRRDLFVIELLTWEMIEEILREHPELWERTVAKSLKSLTAQLEVSVDAIQRSNTAIHARMDDLIRSESQDSIDIRLESVKRHLDSYRQQEAELLLSSLRSNEWPVMTAHQRFRALSLLGRVAADRGDHVQAGRFFIEGAQHFPDDERAKTNRAVGLELVGDRAEAFALARILVAEYTGSIRPWAIICRTAPESVPFADLEAELPSQARDDDEVLIALALRAARQLNWQAVAALSQRVARSDVEWAAPWTLLGQAKLQLVLKSSFKSEQVAIVDPAGYREALACFDRAVACGERTHQLSLHVQALLNRARVRAIGGDLEGANADFSEATRLCPNDSNVLEQFGRHILSFQGVEAAIPILRRAVVTGGDAEAKCSLAVALQISNEPQYRREYVVLASEASRDPTSSFQFHAIELAIKGMLLDFDFDAAEVFAASLSQCGVPNPGVSAALARIIFARNDHVRARQLAMTAHESSSDVSLDCRRFVAETSSIVGLHTQAFTVWQSVATQSRLIPDVWSLIKEAKRLNRHDSIRDICAEWRNGGVVDPILLQEELAVLERYEPQRAVELITQLLSKSPDDRFLQLRLSILGVRLDKRELICTDPSRLPSYREAGFRNGVAVVRVLIDGGNPVAAMEYAYGLLRCHPRNPEVNASFAYTMLQSESALGPEFLTPPEMIQPGAAFCYREVDSNSEHWMVIENQSSEPAFEDELSSDHALAKKVCGLKPGDTFLIDGDELDGRKAVVHGIASKYAYRVGKIVNEWQVRFPEHPCFQMVRIEGLGEDSDGIPDFMPIVRRVHQHKQRVEDALAEYRSSTTPVPIHVLAQHLGLDDVQTQIAIAIDNRCPIRCSSALNSECQRAISALSTATHLVVDVTALTTIRLLELERLLDHSPIPLVVSTHSLAALRAVAARTFRTSGGGSILPSDHGIGIQFVERSEADLSMAREKAERLVESLQRHAAVRDCPALAELLPEKRQLYTNAFGTHGLEAMLLASLPGHLLWTDDWCVAQIAQQEYGVQGIWTQPVLQFIAQRGLLTESDFHQASARLVGYGYESTRYSVPVLRAACEVAEWNASAFPLKQVVETLKKDHAPEVSVQIAFAFIHSLYTDLILHLRHEEMALVVLDAIADGSLGIDPVLALRSRLPLLFRFNLAAERALRMLIDRWLELRREA